MTTAHPEAVERLEDAILAVAGHRVDALARLDAALAVDPELVPALVVRGFCGALQARPEPVAVARRMAARARDAAGRDVSERERVLADALVAWVADRPCRSVELLERYVRDEPRDLLALKLHQSTAFFLGLSDSMVRATSRAARAWDPGVPGYGHYLGCHAFALEEAGQYGEAEPAGRAAVELDPTDIWAGHAVAHVMDMQGRLDEGVRWLEGLRTEYRRCDNMRLHNDWHQALLHLERGDHDLVLVLYDQRLRGERGEDYRDLSDMATLLHRLEQEGVGVGDRWEELADYAAVRVDDHLGAFADAHYALALAGAGRGSALERFVASLDVRVEEAGSTAALLREVVAPLARGIRDAFRGRPELAVAHLAPVRHEVIRVGGSHVQRDVFTSVLVEAALDARRYDVADEALAERAVRRAASPWAERRAERIPDGVQV
ncbi:MAG: tetratricopeptide repeat protein [Sandaracinaceae bacterium]